MSSRPPSPKPLTPLKAGKQAGIRAYQDNNIEILGFNCNLEYRKGYALGLKAAANALIPGTDEYEELAAARDKKKKEAAKRAADRKKAKDEEARRVRYEIQEAHREAIRFHIAEDRRKGATEEEIRETFGMGMTWADVEGGIDMDMK